VRAYNPYDRSAPTRCHSVVLGLLTLGEADNAAADTGAHAFSVATLAVFGHRVLSLVVIVLSFVDNDGAANDGVGAGESDKGVSDLVLGSVVEAGLEVLQITDAAVVDVLVGVATVGTEGVEDVSGGLAAVLEVTELVDLEAVESSLESFEFANDGSEITGLLLKLNAAG